MERKSQSRRGKVSPKKKKKIEAKIPSLTDSGKLEKSFSFIPTALAVIVGSHAF